MKKGIVIFLGYNPALKSYQWFNGKATLQLIKTPKRVGRLILYAPNFGKVEGAYCFGLVRPSVRPLQNLLRCTFEISFFASLIKKLLTHFFKSGLSTYLELCPF